MRNVDWDTSTTWVTWLAAGVGPPRVTGQAP
jgi:hypothetical protein